MPLPADPVPTPTPMAENPPVPRKGPRPGWALPAILIAAGLLAGLVLFSVFRGGVPRFDRIDGTVTLSLVGAHRPASVGTVVRTREIITSDATGGAGLILGEHRHLDLAASSTITPRDDIGKNVIDLGRGRIDLTIAGASATAKPVTIMAVDWTIDGTDANFSVTVDRGGPQVLVTRGEVVVHGSQVALTVGAGQMAERDGYEVPRLLAAPSACGSATHPFAATSAWNRPIPAETTRQALRRNGVDTPAWATTGDRIRRVIGVDGHTVPRLAGGPADPIACALPPGFSGRGPADYLVLMDPAGDRMWEFHGASVNAAGELVAERMLDIDLKGPGATGMLPSGLPLCGGMILAPEADTCIRHALAIHLPAALCAAAGIALGDHLALASDDPHPNSRDLRQHDLGKALRDYGAIVVDNSAAQAQISVDPELPKDVRDSFAQIMVRLAPALMRIAPAP